MSGYVNPPKGLSQSLDSIIADSTSTRRPTSSSRERRPDRSGHPERGGGGGSGGGNNRRDRWPDNYSTEAPSSRSGGRESSRSDRGSSRQSVRHHPYDRPSERQGSGSLDRQRSGGFSTGSTGGRDSRGGGGSGSRHERSEEGEVLPGDVDLPQNSIKVGGTSDPREVAVRIREACSSGELPALLTIGNASINQAVKAIAIARTDLLDERIDLVFQPAFRHPDGTKPLIAFYLSKQRMGSRGSAGGGEVAQLTVAATSKVKTVAGAVAGKTREQRSLRVSAIGVDAVANMVLAVGNARIFLEEDNLDLKVQATFERQMKGGTEVTCMTFVLLTERVQ